jgi:hypothetical protein
MMALVRNRASFYLRRELGGRYASELRDVPVDFVASAGV